MMFPTNYSLLFLVLVLSSFLHIIVQADAAAADSTSQSSLLLNVTQPTGGVKAILNKGILTKFDSDECTITYSYDGESQRVMNLSQLARRDGLPRYNTTFEVTVPRAFNYSYSYNPCEVFSLPRDNPHGNFGDGCHNAILCKYMGKPGENQYSYFYTLGIKAPDKVSLDGVNKPDNETRISFVYQGIKSLRLVKTVVTLVCDRSRSSPNEGLFKIIYDNGKSKIFAELHHRCCCPGACVYNAKSGDGPQYNGDKKSKSDGESMLVIIGTVIGLTLSVVLIAGLCYVKRTHVQFYSKLPGVRSNTTTGSVPGMGGGNGKGTTDFRDYEPSAMAGVRHKLLPVLEDSCIHSTGVEMGKRLGGGIFGDTHLGRFNGMTVTVKRFTLSIHLDQLTEEMMERMKEEVSWISRQRHKNIVSVMALSLDGRLPFLMTEYVLGDCVKDFLRSSSGRMLTWPQRVRMCQQVAEGVSFLHSTKPPIIHRDLRCGNLFISDNDLVKVADFSLTKLLQPMREQCDTDDCSCNRLMSACPAMIRWTAPELLQTPRAKEGESSTISTACDVYSFGMVLWEMVTVRDPFHQMKTETEVVEVVKNGGRPDMPASTNILTPYKALMKTCWDQRPSLRPQCKQVAVRLKEMIGAARSHQRQINNRSVEPKHQDGVMAL